MRKIGLAGATAIGLGAIIGAGIFVLSGTTIALAGTGALLAFILTGIVAVIIALEMGELASAMPNERGGSYSFTYNAFGSELGFVAGALLYLGYTASISAISLGFGAYLTAIFGIQQALYQYAFAILLIIALTLVNYMGVERTASADLILVVFKASVLALFILFALFAGSWAPSRFGGELSTGYGGIFAASVIALFAYAGFQSIAAITPDIEGGGRTAAKAIILSVIISMALYVGVTAALLALVPASQFGFAAAPLTTALQAANAPTWLFLVVDIAALAATASATLGMIVGGSRLLYQMSVDGLLPTRFRSEKKDRETPVNSLLATAFFGMIFLFSGNIYVIAATSNFGTVFSYLLTGLAMLKIRRLRRLGDRELLDEAKVQTRNVFEVPFSPYLPIVSIIAMIVFIYGFPSVALSSGVGAIIISIIVYYTLRELEGKKPVKVRFFGKR